MSDSLQAGERVGVRAVLWDADGVLQRVPGGVEESMRPAVAGLLADVEAFLVEALAAERPALRGEVRWLEVLPGLLERWGIAEAFDDVARVWLTIEEVPGARALVLELRDAGVPCYLATNQAVERAGHMRATLGYDALLDAAFYSHDLGVAKPDPTYFTRVVDRLGRRPSELLLIDDNAANVEAARSVGLAAEVWSQQEPLAGLRGLLRSHGLLR